MKNIHQLQGIRRIFTTAGARKDRQTSGNCEQFSTLEESVNKNHETLLTFSRRMKIRYSVIHKKH